MSQGVAHEHTQAVCTIQSLLEKIDRLMLPQQSRRDVECILVRQVTRELDRALPSHRGHGRRTACLAQRLGAEFSMAEDELHQLKLASYLHDIGLLLLPFDLRENISPDCQSYGVIQNHSRLGSALLEPYGFLKWAAVIVAHHHERWDGTGYPYGIRGRFIPFGARILSVADAFDAIAVPKVLDRRTRDLIALRIIQVGSGTQFDPSVVTALAEVLMHEIPAISKERTDE